MTDDFLARLRNEYADVGLSEASVDADPFVQFNRWMSDAIAASIHEPNAVLLATATPDGVPSARMVLLKGVDERGFTFFTNYRSRKATELDQNPSCALVAPWHALHRQVRIEGAAQRTTVAESAAYFATRPRPAQLGALASPQSQLIPDRAFLMRRYAEVARRWAEDSDIPLPEGWGGYRVAPTTVEFWQGRASRLHDRLRYRRWEERWLIERLAP